MKKLAFFCRTVASTVAVVWTMLFASGRSIEAAELKVGDDAPPFSLKGSDGKTYALKDFAGKQPVVLAWFPKAFTPGCTKECRNFQTDSAALKKYDVAYFTISVDEPERNTEFANSLHRLNAWFPWIRIRRRDRGQHYLDMVLLGNLCHRGKVILDHLLG